MDHIEVTWTFKEELKREYKANMEAENKVQNRNVDQIDIDKV